MDKLPIGELIKKMGHSRLYTDEEVERIIDKACILINADNGQNGALEEFLCQVTTLGCQYMDLKKDNTFLRESLLLAEKAYVKPRPWPRDKCQNSILHKDRWHLIRVLNEDHGDELWACPLCCCEWVREGPDA